eukprot:4201230-Ditylum_brightwellii.AAC.1
MLDGDAVPPVIDSFHVMTCSTCGGIMHNRHQCRMPHDGFGNAMCVAEMDKAISKGHLIVKVDHMMRGKLLSCSMEGYNSMRKNQ